MELYEEEEEHEDPARFSKCYICNTPLKPIEGGGNDNRKRFRKCRACINKTVRKNRELDPVRNLHFKWRSAVNKRPLEPEAKHLASLQTVRSVYERCQHKSVLSGESNHSLLCMASKVKRPRTEEDLVIITTNEALALGKKKTDEDRLRFFTTAQQDQDQDPE